MTLTDASSCVVSLRLHKRIYFSTTMTLSLSFSFLQRMGWKPMVWRKKSGKKTDQPVPVKRKEKEYVHFISRKWKKREKKKRAKKVDTQKWDAKEWAFRTEEKQNVDAKSQEKGTDRWRRVIETPVTAFCNLSTNMEKEEKKATNSFKVSFQSLFGKTFLYHFTKVKSGVKRWVSRTVQRQWCDIISFPSRVIPLMLLE